MKYTIAKQPDGTWRAAMVLPHGDGSLEAVASGLSKGEATIKAARVAQATGKAPVKGPLVANLAKAAQNPLIRKALQEGGMMAAEAAAAAIPGGGAVLKALKLASKYGPAKRLLSRLVK